MKDITTIQLIKELIKRTKKGRGKPCDTLVPSCPVCQATILIAYLEDEIRYHKSNK
jgi:hypothetical protein